MSKPASLPVAFEPEFIAGLRQIFEEKIPFNHLLGLKITRLEPAAVAARIDMRPDLVGHFAYNRLHGGVISAGLDAMGGLAVMAAIGMFSGYCGTLMTPMAANFNIVPAALLELPEKNDVVKVQIMTALPLLAANIALLHILMNRF